MTKLIVTVEVPDKFIGSLPVAEGFKSKLGATAAMMGIKVLNVEAVNEATLDKK